ncbi:MAG TPA: DUF2225 domain-containing protein [Limnochordia bacterium]
MLSDLARAAARYGLRMLRVPAGGVLYDAGDTAAEMYVLLSGRLRLADREVEAGGLIGARALIERGERRERVVALTDAIVLAMDHREFDTLRRSEPELAARLLQSVAGEVRASEGPALASPVVRLEGFEPSPLLFLKTVSCPVCETRFEAEVVRETRLEVASRQRDLRVRYVGIEPLWYRVLVCPNCLFAARRPAFAVPLGATARAALERHAAQRRETLGDVSFTRPRSLQSAQAAVRSAALCAELARRPTVEKGTVALWGAWLADDADDAAAAAGWREEALSAFRSAFEGEATPREPKGDQRLAYLIGVLLDQLGRQREALPFLLKAIELERSGDRWLAEQARDVLRDTRERLANERSSPGGR